MSWKERMNAGIGEYLRSIGKDAIEVTDYDEGATVSGPYGCETCGPEYDTEFNVTIYYRDSKGAPCSYWYDGSFVDFIDGIT